MSDPSPESKNGNAVPQVQTSPTPRARGLFGWIAELEKPLPDAVKYSWLWVIPIVVILGIGSIPIYAQFVPKPYNGWNVVGSALMFGGAAFLTGGLLGLLFGIPKAATSAAPKDSDYTANTNLEQISDWLTKIVVGLTLTQLGRIPGALGRLADVMKAPLGGQRSSAAFGLALVIFYAVLGFLYLYLWSRTLLQNELAGSGASAQDQAKGEPQPQTQTQQSKDQPQGGGGGTAPKAAPGAQGGTDDSGGDQKTEAP